MATAEDISPVPNNRIKKSVEKEKARKPMSSRVSIHDRTQLEAVFSYPIRDPGNDGKKYRVDYAVDAFFFIPPQMAVTPSNYNKSQFYSDLRAFIRLREPKLSFRQLLGKGKQGDESPLTFLRSYTDRALADQQLEPSATAIDEARVFGCSYVSFYLRRVDRRVKALSNLRRDKRAEDGAVSDADVQKFVQRTEEFLNRSYEVLNAYRQVRRDLSGTANDVLVDFKAEVRLIDEYASHGFRDGLLRLIVSLREGVFVVPAEEMTRISAKLEGFLASEHDYARMQGFVWITETSSPQEREEYVYRKGALKKRAWSVLYLSPRPQVLFELRKQMAPMVAAGFAAMWAILATVFIWKYSNFRGYGLIDKFSTYSFAAIAFAFTTSYILKDRIKELGRQRFSRGLLGNRPDLSYQISYENKDGASINIGTVNETMRFAALADIDPNVRTLRDQMAHELLDLDSLQETIIHYRKKIRLRSDGLRSLRQRLRAVHDIMRLNIERFLPKLDNPYYEDLYLSQDGRVDKTLMSKVYHLDLVLKLTPLTRGKETNQRPLYRSYKVIVDKMGLVRIDKD